MNIQYLVLEEELDHLEVLVVDGHEEGAAAERVHAVDVQLPGVLAAVQHPKNKKIARLLSFRTAFY